MLRVLMRTGGSHLGREGRREGGREGGIFFGLVLRDRTLLAYLSVCLTPCRSRAATAVHLGGRTQGPLE